MGIALPFDFDLPAPAANTNFNVWTTGVAVVPPEIVRNFQYALTAQYVPGSLTETRLKIKAAPKNWEPPCPFVLTESTESAKVPARIRSY